MFAQNIGTAPAVSANNASSGGALYGSCFSGEGLCGQSGRTAGTSAGKTRNGVHGVTDSAADSAVWGEAVSGGFGVSGSTSSSGLQGPAGVWG